MESILTPSNVMFALGILGAIFTVYNYFKNPQIKSEKIDAILTLKFDILEKSFANLRDNHIHTIESKLDTHIKENQMTAESNIRQMTRIETLLEQLIKK